MVTAADLFEPLGQAGDGVERERDHHGTVHAGGAEAHTATEALQERDGVGREVRAEDVVARQPFRPAAAL